MDLGGKTTLLTGATGGLGRAIATALAARGARLILSSRKAEELVKLARSLPGGGHTTLVSDLAEEGAALALLEQADDIDVLVANAALPASGCLDGFSQDQIGRALRVNLESPVRMARELLPAGRNGAAGTLSSSLRSLDSPRPHGLLCTRPRSSVCVASRSIYEKTCAAAALASR
jgi:NAD(P)-dependent dehydrogenase (short-subunit alcohol dehydrogenase family)